MSAEKEAQIRKHINEGPEDAHASRELLLFTENDSNLYHQMIVPIQKNLVKKIEKGQYEYIKAVVAARNLMDEAARRYTSGGVRRVPTPMWLTPNVRTHAAMEWVETFQEEVKDGNFK